MTDTRPILAMVTGHLTPYRVSFYRRIVAEMPEVRLAVLVTKNQSTMWKAEEMPEIGTVLLDRTDVDWFEAEWIPFLRHERATAKATVAWLKEHRPVAVVTVGYDEIPVFAAVSWARKKKVPVFIAADSNIRSDTTRGVRRLIKRLLIPRLVRRYTGVMPCGSLGRAYFEYYGGDPRTFFEVPFEPDYAAIEGLSPERVREVAARHGLAPGRRRIVCCNRLVSLKRVDQVIDAFAAIAPERPEWDLVIVGDGPLRAELEARVPAGMRERVRFLGQVAASDEVGAIYRCSDALVLASMHEAWALVVNEAAAAGCAIVVSDVVGAAPELVREGRNGFTFPPGNLGALTDRLRRATAPGVIDALKEASPRVLREWRDKADPVAGVRAALRWRGVIRS